MTTYYVGNGAYSTIQEAITALATANEPGPHTISISNGHYVGPIEIDGLHDITIEAAPGQTEVFIDAPSTLVQTSVTGAGRAIDAVITVENSTNVVIRGVTVDGQGAGNTVVGAANFVGVFYKNSSGGLENVDVTGVRDAYAPGTAAGGEPIQNGSQRGVGVQVDNSSLMAFTMTGGTISDFQKNATVFNGAILNVTGVEVIGGGAQTIIAQNGIQVLNSTGTISGNTITDIGYAGPSNVYSGGVLAYGNTDLDITNNTIVGANIDSRDAKVVGIYVTDFGTPNDGGTVSGNTISNVDEGIDVSGNFVNNALTVGSNTITQLDFTDPAPAGIYYAADTGELDASVTGTALNDVFVSGSGDETFDGLGGTDTIDLSKATSNVSVNLNSGFAISTSTGSDTLVSIENVVGSKFNDLVIGSSSYNTFYTNATAGNGIATQTGNRLIVNSAADGTDDLRGIEQIVFKDGVIVDVNSTTGNAKVTTVADATSLSEDAASVAGNMLTNDINIDATSTDKAGLVSITVGSTTYAVGTPIVTAYGTLTFAANGSYTFTTNANAQTLALGETAPLVFSYTVSDGSDTSTGHLTVTVNGVNDTPTVTNVMATVTEPGVDANNVDVAGTIAPIGGTLVAADVDQGAVLTWTPSSQSGVYGTFTSDNAGVWSYSFNPAAADGLGEADQRTETYSVVVADQFGASATQTVTITIQGTNDRPVITGGVTTDTVFEAGSLDDFQNAGPAGGFDAHYTPGSPAVASALLAMLGSPTAAGTSVADALALVEADMGPLAGPADAIAAIFDYLDNYYTDTPGNPAAHYYDVGHNTATIRLGIEYVAYLEAGGRPLTDVIVKYKPDADLSGQPDRLQSMHDNLLGNFNAGGLNDRFSNPSAPIYAEIHDAGLDYLITRPYYGGSEGESAAATLASDRLHDLIPDASGQLTGTDAENNTLTWSGSQAGTYGQLTVNADGSWSYVLNNADADTQGLAQGDIGHEHLAISVSDGHGGVATSYIDINITGSNDAPTVTVVDSDIAGSVTEAGVDGSNADVAGTPSATGTLVAADLDTGHSLTWSTDATAADSVYGAFAINAAGEWSYTLDAAAADSLSETDTRTETFTATVTDEFGATATQTVTITIQGTNDRPVITGGLTTDTLFEAGSLDAVTDHSPARFQPTLNLTAGIVTALTANGADMDGVLDDVAGLIGTSGSRADAIAYVWNYLNAAYETGPVGGTPQVNAQFARLSLEYARYLTVDHGAPLLDIIAKDGPTAGRMQSLHDNLLGNLTDGALTQRWNNPGNPTYNDPALYAEFHGAVQTEFPVLLARPTFSGNPGAVNMAEAFDWAFNLVPHASGQLTGTDAENNTLTWSGSQAGTYGQLTVNADGSWTYTLNNTDGDTAALAEGQSGTETLTVSVSDGHGGVATSNIVINITGSNDAPTVTVVDSDIAGSVAEAGVDGSNAALAGMPTATGTLVAADLDTGHSLTWSTDATAADSAYGAFAINAAGEWSYTLDAAAANSLSETDTRTETFTATVTDEFGATATQTVTITIQGTNDAPVLSGSQGTLANAIEDTHYIGNLADLLVGFTDPDSGATLSVANLTVGPHATLVGINVAAGTFELSFDANYNDPVTLSYDVVDGLGGSVSATQTLGIDAVVDNPVGPLTGALAGGTEDVLYHFSTADLLGDFSDPDGGALSLDSLSASFGTLVASGNGNGYDLVVPANYNTNGGAITLSFNVKDSNGGILSGAQRTVAIAAVNDAPTLPSSIIVPLTEDGLQTFNLLTGAGDVDGPGALTLNAPTVFTFGGTPRPTNGPVFLPSSTPGELVLNSAEFQYLSTGETATISFDYTVTDALGAVSDVRHVTLQVVGATEVVATPFPNGDNILTGGQYGDLITGGTGDDVVTAGAGNDVVNAGTGDDKIDGGSGNDAINGDSGDDRVDGGSGNDTVHGGDGDDYLIGGSGDDNVYGDAGDDTIEGNSGIDHLFGGNGNDLINGGGGDDFITGGLGKDTLTGGAGVDTFIYTSAAESEVGAPRDSITDFTLDDRIDVTALNLVFLGQGTADRVVGEQGLKYYYYGGNTYVTGNSATGTTANFQIELRGEHVLTRDNFVGLVGSSVPTDGNDNLIGTGAADTMHGGLGDDMINGRGGKDVLYGDAGADTFVFGKASDTAVGLATRDVIADFNLAEDKIDVSAIGSFVLDGPTAVGAAAAPGHVAYYHYLNNTYLVGNAEGQAFQIEITGTHYLKANNFAGTSISSSATFATPLDDVLVGTGGNDAFNGLAGNDFITGLGGKDTLTGGAGDDHFVYLNVSDSAAGANRDVITDFTESTSTTAVPDHIDLQALQYLGHDLQFSTDTTIGRVVSAGEVRAYQFGGNTYVVANVSGATGDADFQIELTGNHVLTASDFLL